MMSIPFFPKSNIWTHGLKTTVLTFMGTAGWKAWAWGHPNMYLPNLSHPSLGAVLQVVCPARPCASWRQLFRLPLILPSLIDLKGFPGRSLVKNLSARQEMQVLSQGEEDPVEKEMATHSNILAWRTPRIKEPGGLKSMRLQESDTTQQLNNRPKMSKVSLSLGLPYCLWNPSGRHSILDINILALSSTQLTFPIRLNRFFS